MIAARKKTFIREIREDFAGLPGFIAENKKTLAGVCGVFAFIMAMPTLVILSEHLPTISDTAGTYIAVIALVVGVSIVVLAYKFVYHKKE